ncbi:hypothetical protein L6R49_23725 [Myxococcota bacterium]|nr:hypothetical protein [Myxococcota bacterium]
MSSFDDPRAPKPPSSEDMQGVLDLARKFQEEESALRVNVRGYSQEAEERIDPRHMDRAMRIFRQRALEQAETKARLESIERHQKARSRAVGMAAAFIGGALGLGVFGLAGYGADRLTRAEAAAISAEAEVQESITTQLSLSKAVLDLGGAEDRLKPLILRASGTSDLNDRVEAARALNLALTGELGRVKPPKGDAVAARLELERAIADGDRVLGEQQQQWLDAVAEREAADASSAGRLARFLGLVSEPDPAP